MERSTKGDLLISMNAGYLTDETESCTYRAARRLAVCCFVFVPVLCLYAVSCAEVLHGHQTHHIFLHRFHYTRYYLPLTMRQVMHYHA